MRANEFITEDDYYPPDRDEQRREEIATRDANLEEFIDQYIEEYLGAPHRGGASRHFGDMKIHITVPKHKITSGPRRQNRSEAEILKDMKNDWRETAEEVIDSVRSEELGDFELTRVGPFGMELVEKSSLNENTCAGGIATVVGGLGVPAITRNASIYGPEKKSSKKKKKTAKYANSKD